MSCSEPNALLCIGSDGTNEAFSQLTDVNNPRFYFQTQLAEIVSSATTLSDVSSITWYSTGNSQEFKCCVCVCVCVWGGGGGGSFCLASINALVYTIPQIVQSLVAKLATR